MLGCGSSCAGACHFLVEFSANWKVAAGALTGAVSRDVLVCFTLRNERYGGYLRQKAKLKSIVEA